MKLSSNIVEFDSSDYIDGADVDTPRRKGKKNLTNTNEMRKGLVG